MRSSQRRTSSLRNAKPSSWTSRSASSGPGRSQWTRRRRACKSQFMSERSIEIVREIYDRWSEGDFRTPFEHMDENVVFILPLDLPESGTYFGRAALAEYSRGFLEPWTHVTIEAEELLPAGDSVLASIVQRAMGDASGAETELRYFQLWSLRGDKVIRLEAFRDRAEALAAAGLSDG